MWIQHKKGAISMDEINMLQIGFTVFSGIITIAVSYIGYQIQKRDAKREKERKALEELREKKDHAIYEGMLTILHNSIIELYNNCVQKNNVSIRAAENMTHMYNAYHNLGGNGAITEIYHHFQQLPHKPSSSHAQLPNLVNSAPNNVPNNFINRSIV